MVEFQRSILYERIIEQSQFHVVHPGIDFGQVGELVKKEEGEDGLDEEEGREGNNMLMSIFEAPGVLEGECRIGVKFPWCSGSNPH